MTDLEMTKLCAEAMGYEAIETGALSSPYILVREPYGRYHPLHDDAQAMALVKRFDLTLDKHGSSWWNVEHILGSLAMHKDLNRAIVECVAKMQAATS